MSRRPASSPSPPSASPSASPPATARRVLDHLEQVRVLAHPLRLRLLELFAEAPRTTKQAADRLSLPPTRLYHHVAALERVGLVRVRETRRNRGTIEKHYEAIARGFEMDTSRFARGRGKAARAAAARLAGEGVSALALRVLERARDGLVAALDATAGADLAPEDARRPLAIHAGLVASPVRLVALRAELLAVIEHWQGKKTRTRHGEDAAEETMRAWLTIVLAPEVPDVQKVREKRGKGSGSGGRRPVGGT